MVVLFTTGIQIVMVVLFPNGTTVVVRKNERRTEARSNRNFVPSTST
jgi:hypothetical protein